MTSWAQGMIWLNPPPQTRWDGDALIVTTGRETDFWQTTFYDFVHDNGHALLGPTDGDFTAEVRFSGDYRTLYDQAGLMLYANATHWIKAGIEYTDGMAHVSVVVTRGYSDWSVVPLPNMSGALDLRLSRHGDAIRVQYCDAAGMWQMARLAYFPPELPVQIGPMCCSPLRAGFQARFEKFALGVAIDRELH